MLNSNISACKPYQRPLTLAGSWGEKKCHSLTLVTGNCLYLKFCCPKSNADGRLPHSTLPVPS